MEREGEPACFTLRPGRKYGTVMEEPPWFPPVPGGAREKERSLPMGIRLGLCQMRVTPDKQENLRRAESCLRQAAAQGANLALLPEMFNCPYENACFPVYGEPAGGETGNFFPAVAGSWGFTWREVGTGDRGGGHLQHLLPLLSPGGRSWPATARFTSLTLMCRGASGLWSRTPSPPAARSRW